MIVGINARILAGKTIRGWSRYACNLIRGLHERNISLYLFSDQEIEKKWIPQELHSKVIVKKGINYIHWEQFVLPRLCDLYKVDLLHCPTNYGLPQLGSFKKVITLHDAIEKSYYDQFKTNKQKWSWLHIKNRGLHHLSHQAADKVITVSEYAKQDIVKSYGVFHEKIAVIYEAADELFSEKNIMAPDDFKKKFNLTAGYYFYVGGLEKRKNIPLLLELAQKLESRGFILVIAGGEKHASAPQNVKYLGYVEERHLPSLYAYSKCLIYPSFNEGFGLQLVESMQMGKPAIYANTTSLPEVYGTKEYGFSPFSVDEAVQCVSKVDSDYSAAVEYANHRKLFFSWEKSIDQTLQVYKNVLS